MFDSLTTNQKIAYVKNKQSKDDYIYTYEQPYIQ